MACGFHVILVCLNQQAKTSTVYISSVPGTGLQGFGFKIGRRLGQQGTKVDNMLVFAFVVTVLREVCTRTWSWKLPLKLMFNMSSSCRQSQQLPMTAAWKENAVATGQLTTLTCINPFCWLKFSRRSWASGKYLKFADAITILPVTGKPMHKMTVIEVLLSCLYGMCIQGSWFQWCEMPGLQSGGILPSVTKWYERNMELTPWMADLSYRGIILYFENQLWTE